MRARWTTLALRQAERAARFIARERPLVALNWTNGLVDAMDRAAAFPESGRVYAGFQNPRLRELVYRDVRVIYRIDPAEIVVLIVWHQRRDPRKLERLVAARQYSR